MHEALAFVHMLRPGEMVDLHTRAGERFCFAAPTSNAEVVAAHAEPSGYNPPLLPPFDALLSRVRTQGEDGEWFVLYDEMRQLASMRVSEAAAKNMEPGPLDAILATVGCGGCACSSEAGCARDDADEQAQAPCVELQCDDIVGLVIEG